MSPLAVAMMMALPSAALACRSEIPQEQELRAYSRVAVVSVTKVEPGFMVWRLSATLKQAIKGTPEKAFEFSQESGSGDCVLPQPRPGDLWVVYGDDSLPTRFYSLSQATVSDPRLDAIWR